MTTPQSDTLARNHQKKWVETPSWKDGFVLSFFDHYRLGAGWLGVLLYCTLGGTITASSFPALYA